MHNHHDLSAPAADAPRVIDFAAGRRAFLRSIGIGAATAALAGTAAGLPGSAKAQSADLDVEILNFALNLEYLEAEFYLNAVFGTGLPSNAVHGVGTVGAVYGGHQVPFSDPVVKAYALEIASDERSHVTFLRGVLGNSAVARPPLNIGTSFTIAARAAGVIGPKETFNVYENDDNFLLGAYIFEDVGVTAYHGAAPLITNKDYLLAAAGILAVEAYHAGLVRTVLYSKGLFSQTEKISTLRATLDGSATSPQGPDDQGVNAHQSYAFAGASNIVPTDADSVAFARSPGQVLDIVYGATNATKGLFFPSGAYTGFNAGQTG